MSETKTCEYCNTLSTEDINEEKYICQQCLTHLFENKQHIITLVKAFEEIQFELLEDYPEYENVRNVKDIVNKILEEEQID